MFPLLRRAAPEKIAPPDKIGGIAVRISARAKRMALRVDNKTGRVVLTLPQRKKWTTHIINRAEKFVRDNRAWIVAHDKPRHTRPLAAGDTLNLLDKTYVLAHQAGRGLSHLEDDKIIITGAPEHFNRRLKDFLKKEALRIITDRAAQKAQLIGLPPSEIVLRDPATRWGSCGPDGRMMFSWRLILTPDDVLDYVVAHEVAHRKHMNHGPAFWRLCLSLTPRGRAAKQWLREHADSVMSAV